jgi:hypothetical protein
MCGPTAIAAATFGIGVAKNVFGFMGQRRQYAENERFRAENRVASNEAAITRYGALQTRQLQEAEAAGAQNFDIAVNATRARSAAIASASEGGVAGLSVDALVNDFATQAGRQTDATNRNLEMGEQYLRGEMEATRAQAISRVQSVPITQRPGIGSLMLGVASSAVDSFSLYNQFKI